MFCHNFYKCEPTTSDNDTHLTWNVLLHYLEKVEDINKNASYLEYA